MKTIYLAGGCFWGMQKFYDQFKGVLETSVGYANGYVDNPTYPDVKAQKTGHAETVNVSYDENIISLEKILEYFFQVIDPTSLNKQGEDEGTSYRTGIYYVNEEDLPIIQAFMESQIANYINDIVVEVESLKSYWLAEEYHQKYLEKNPEGYCHIGGCFFEMEQD